MSAQLIFRLCFTQYRRWQRSRGEESAQICIITYVPRCCRVQFPHLPLPDTTYVRIQFQGTVPTVPAMLRRLVCHHDVASMIVSHWVDAAISLLLLLPLASPHLIQTGGGMIEERWMGRL